jgi:flagellar motor switch protein FliG
MMTGRQKAALLLSTLEPTAAAELLRGVDEVVVKDLAVEIAYFEASGQSLDEQTFELAREFCSCLEKGGKEQKVSFVDRLLKSSLGAEKAANIQIQIADLLNQRDPFLPLKKAADNELVAALNIE